MGNTFLGEIKPFAGRYAPSGWVECNGATLRIAEFQALFSLIGTQFGGSVSQGYFNVPDMRGRVTVGTGQGAGLSPWVMNDLRGAESVALTVDQIPNHTHTVSTEFAPYGTHTGNFTSAPTANTSYPSRLLDLTNPAKVQTYNVYAKAATVQRDTWLSDAALGMTGGIAAHENRQPVLAVRFAINATEGVYPDFD